MGAGAKLTGRKRAADATLDADGAAAIASSFKAKRTKPATKRMYSSKMSVMLEWIRNKFPALIAPGSEDCRLPLPKDAVLGFFGHLVQPAHEFSAAHVAEHQHSLTFECTAPSVPLAVGRTCSSDFTEVFSVSCMRSGQRHGRGQSTNVLVVRRV